MDNNYLAHYGILGMRWGVRRARRAANSTSRDASDLRKHGYIKEANAVQKVSDKQRKKADELQQKINIKNADKLKKSSMKEDSKNRRLLSDADIKRKIDRIKMEQQLKSLTKEELSPGKKFVSDVLSSSGKKVATSIVTGAMLYGIKIAMTKNFDIKEAASYMTPKPKNK